MPTIDLIYFDAGGGHRAASQALRSAILQQRRGWTVRCVNLVDMIDPQARFRHLTGIAPEDLYNKRLARGWTLGLAQELKLLQAAIRLGHGPLVQRLCKHWEGREPDLVVSLIPNFNRVLCEAATTAVPFSPFVTVMTDMADFSPHFWIEPDLPQHLICGTARAVQQALAAGCMPERVHRVSGMMIRPDFYSALQFDRDAERVRLGLEPGRPTGVVMFGGQGSMDMLTIARQLTDVQLVLLCGHHETLASRLRKLPTTAPHLAVGFTPQVRRFMMTGDFFIGKPGPGALSEALHCGLPVVTVRNAWTMPQERYNTEWAQELGVGLVGGSIRRIRPVVIEAIGQLGALRERAQRVRNRAVFEVPDILAELLARRICRRSPAAIEGRQTAAMQGSC